MNMRRFFKDNWALLLAMLYVLVPIDILPDFLPGLGWTDDLGALVLAFVIKFLQHLQREKQKKKDIIDGEVVK